MFFQEILMNRWTNRQMERWTQRQTDEQTDKQMTSYMLWSLGTMNYGILRTDGQRDGYPDRWIDS